ncbi:MAG: DUF11 domain-containing protein [Candidatus Eremiobacteraeota bacterium]|nr:DUF11 domain-containing protein [Candidatus Eremiobacteraeota bacterium]
MRTLTEVFTPGAPSLPEGLRTLVVSPERELEPGMTVRASFQFRNQGGAPATGVRVRMNMPDGLVYLIGTGLLDGVELDDEQGNCPLLSRNGAHIGDVGPGEERSIEIAYSVAGAIENGSTIELQAAVAAFEIAPVGSNIVRLVVRSHPVLENQLTNVAIEARHGDAYPGAEATVTVRVHNAGESSAHDVVAVVPVPSFTSYIPNSARVNGRELEADLKVPFDRAYAPVIARTLPASATVTLTYRIRIDDPLDDATPIVAHATIASQETPSLTLADATVTVQASARFDDDQTSVTTEPATDVAPGQRVTVRLHATNAGTMAAHHVTAALTLADGLLLVRGASRLDGRPLREKKKETGVFEIGRVDARASVQLSVDAMVASPLPNGTQLELSLQLQWESGERAFPRTLTVRSQPFLAPRRNGIESSSAAVVRPGDEVEAVITVNNDGSAAATDAVLELHVDPALDDLVLLEKNTKLALEERSYEIDRIEPYATRRFTVRARVRSPYHDRAEVAIGASLHTLELGESALGEAKYRVDSHPAFTAQRSTLGLVSDDVLRPNQLADVYVRLINEGTDVANDVRLRLYISPEARLESVDGATREKSSLLFGEIAPGASVEARLGLRLLRSLAREFPVTIDGVLTANSVLPTPLHRMTIVTTAEPDFAVGALRSEPVDTADVGETIEYVLHVRNGGDGPARRVQVNVDSTDSLIYVPNSTTVNDVSVRDIGALAPFASDRGIVLNDVDPGIEATIRWRDVVHNGLSAGESIVRVAHIRYDGERHDEIASSELKVRSAPSFANNIPGLPFGLDGMVGPSLAGGMRALPNGDDRFVELPPATPVSRADVYETHVLEEPETHYLSSGDEVPQNGASHAVLFEDLHAGSAKIATLCAFTHDQLEKTLRFLDEARFGGLVSHLFAIRAFLPTAAGGSGTVQKALESERDQLRDALDRLFIKLRLPNYVVAPRDIETPAMRGALASLVSALESAEVDRPPRQAAPLQLTGGIDSASVSQLHGALDDAALSSAAPWYALAALMVDSAPALRAYRSQLCAYFEGLLELEPQVFLDVLQREAVPALDSALAEVKTGLLTLA